jgi:hypothetical protein
MLKVESKLANRSRTSITSILEDFVHLRRKKESDPLVNIIIIFIYLHHLLIELDNSIFKLDSSKQILLKYLTFVYLMRLKYKACLITDAII